jgi:hypothetical protein
MQPNKKIYSLLLIALLAAVITASALYAENALNQKKDASQMDSTGSITTYTTTGDMFPLPEYEVGGSLIVIAVCLGAFALYKKRQK